MLFPERQSEEKPTMRDSDTLPAWAARRLSRRLSRHGDEKIVRWIGQRAGKATQAAQPWTERDGDAAPARADKTGSTR